MSIRERINPYRLYLFGMELPSAFLVSFAYTTAIVYYVDSGHLNPLQLVALGTALEVAYFVAQLPTGVLADLVSRRMCIVLGWILTGAGFAEQGLSPQFGNLVAAEVLIGIGAALQAGAQDAWIADELDEDAMTPVYVRATQLGLIGVVGGAVLSGVVASQRLYLPMLVGGIGISLVGVVLAFVLPQHNFQRPDERGDLDGQGDRIGRSTQGQGSWAGILGKSWDLFTAQLRASRTAVLAVPGFVLLLGMTFFVGMWSESFDRLWSDFFLRDIRFPVLLGLGPTTWFSVIAVVVALFGLGATELAGRRIDRLGHAAVAGTLLAVTVLIGVGVLVMTSAHAFALALAAYLLVQVLRPVAYPLVTGWIVSRVDSRVRATALSARDMVDSGGQIIGGPVVGWIGVIGTIRAALYAGAVALGPAIALLAAATRRIPALEPAQDAGETTGAGQVQGVAAGHGEESVGPTARSGTG